MTELMQKIEKIARERKEESVKGHEEMVPACLLIKDNVVVGLVLMTFNDEQEKRAAFKSCGYLCAEKDFDGTAIVVDALFRRVNAGDPDADQTKLPSEVPPSQREEAIVIKYTDFRDLNKNEFVMVPYEQKGDMVSFSTETHDFDGMSGQLEGCLLVGFMTEMVRKYLGEGYSPEEAGKEFFKNYFQGIDELPGVKQSISMGF